MDPMSIAIEPVKELLDAQTYIWNHIYSYLSLMALKCAIQLGIPDAIQKHGRPMTLVELGTSLSFHPNKALSLGQLMRLLVHSNFFSKQLLSSSEEAFELTLKSQLLLKDHPFSLVPFVLMVLDPIFVESSHYLSSWFQNDDDTPFHTAHRKSLWECISCVPEFNKLFNDAMASDTQFVVNLLISSDEFKGLWEGVESLVDVGGGNGTMAKAIAKLFPELRCAVFDLPHVVQELTGYGKNLIYFGGGMFKAIPPAQAVLLKWILHNWSDEDCIKILERCKEAIPSKEIGGKIIIINMVVENNNENNIPDYLYSQLLLVLQVMNITTGGKERTEEEWRKLFISAGLNDYKIFRNIGSRSVIEVYTLNFLDACDIRKIFHC
ncbi:trans-resveratrol di-O-methyltransferase-like [Chenopodium quinoa]|uniref:trans-resveratrol di-O-methyltransferase-like n=1 Tax=Chenopodium quinoa TaxID=63459 RepID=UPI000B77DEF4|nr:trans-resveratrol di-O-methyltransferase-like [Chenopodium quinoa]